MPIQQKLTPPVLLFSDFAGWEGLNESSYRNKHCIHFQDYELLVLSRLYYREINYRLVKLTTLPYINNKPTIQKNFFYTLKKTCQFLDWQDKNIEVRIKKIVFYLKLLSFFSVYLQIHRMCACMLLMSARKEPSLAIR